MDKTAKILKSLAPRAEIKTPIATEIFLPNHSGDHSAGHVTTPVDDWDIANKKYVDDHAGGVSDHELLNHLAYADAGHTGFAPALGADDNYVTDAEKLALHARQHSITSTSDHTSTATSGKMLKADANGLPVNATNTDTEAAAAYTHSQIAGGNSVHVSVAENTNWDTAYTHSQNNTQAHTDYMLNTGDTATGDYAFDTSVLKIDAANDRIGIGTATPGAILDVKGVAATDLPTYSEEFLDADNWTSADWTGSWAAGWDHTPGNVTALSHDHAAVSATKYQITYTVSGRTAGEFSITFGGVTSPLLAGTGAWGPTTTGVGVLTITPSNLFDGAIIISIKSLTAVSSPLVRLVSSNGTARTEMRAVSGSTCVYVGNSAGSYNTTASNNVGIGSNALYKTTTGHTNMALGANSLYSNDTGYQNAAMGATSLYYNETGYSNTAIGYYAGSLATGSTHNHTSNNSIYIGYGAGAGTDGNTNEIVIGNNFYGNGSNSVTIGNSSVVLTCLRKKTGVGTVAPDAPFEVETSTTEALQAITIDQNDEDVAFIDYQGTSAADASKNISTRNGDGSVEGPKNFSASAGWAFAGMIKIEVNGTAYWTPYYSVDTS